MAKDTYMYLTAVSDHKAIPAISRERREGQNEKEK